MTLRPQSNDALIEEVISGYIGLYFYAAQTNYWSQFYLPSPGDFDETNENQPLNRRIVDLSYHDVQYMAGVLAKIDQNRLTKNPLGHLYTATLQYWAPRARSSSEVFILNAKQVQT